MYMYISHFCVRERPSVISCCTEIPKKYIVCTKCASKPVCCGLSPVWQRSALVIHVYILQRCRKALHTCTCRQQLSVHVTVDTCTGYVYTMYMHLWCHHLSDYEVRLLHNPPGYLWRLHLDESMPVHCISGNLYFVLMLVNFILYTMYQVCFKACVLWSVSCMAKKCPSWYYSDVERLYIHVHVDNNWVYT